jgi:hypothetical protein
LPEPVPVVIRVGSAGLPFVDSRANTVAWCREGRDVFSASAYGLSTHWTLVGR